MLKEIKNSTQHFFVDEQARRQGEYKLWHDNGQLWVHCFYVDNNWDGEFKTWHNDGTLYNHCFYVNDTEVSFDEIPYPETEEDRMYFKLKYNLQLLPDTIASCAIITAS